ncbi:sensor histidine kinase [Sphingobacterium deserti]|uniref:histidine kinase n=1 Tax=Sphingobacterium deserti TaxID=1229276 RepID=A0A0B8T6W3_9SPHI|nr:HAMP domain-containing sensor histidine kinase [Sphingobacterium deserti]KGE13175.1 ATPase domain-containing protein [Sphingobacterium deserti]
MIKLIEVPVENELDLTLAYRKSIKAGELTKISISMRTAFATAVSEVCREVIEKGLDGQLYVAVETDESIGYHIVANLRYKEVIPLNERSEGFIYAGKLLTYFDHQVQDGFGTVVLKLKIPQSAGISRSHVNRIKHYFQEIEPQTPYENLRKRNTELFKTNEQSAEALRTAEYIIEQKNEFLSVASHELKTPMTILRALTQLALKKNADADLSEQLLKIDMQARKMQDMISQLLDISKSEYDKMDYKFEEVELNSYLRSQHDLIKNLVPQHFIVFTDSPEPCAARIDKLRMEQVVNNLIGNAAKYSQNGSTINVSLSYEDETDCILLAVQDSGIGLAEDDLKKVFDKFYRVTNVSKKIAGLGVGLYISSKIVFDHAGEIWAESTLGKGSTFYVRIPTLSNRHDEAIAL